MSATNIRLRRDIMSAARMVAYWSARAGGWALREEWSDCGRCVALAELEYDFLQQLLQSHYQEITP